MLYPAPGTEGSKVEVLGEYGNFIGGKFIEPVKGQYFQNVSPITGEVIGQMPRSTAEDIKKTLNTTHTTTPT